MLKKRIIGSIVLKDKWVVQSINFEKYLPIGQLKHSVDILDRWGVDEILVLDISASKSGCRPDFKLISESTENINVPLTVGGGIKKVSDMIELLKSGADKICLNHSTLENEKIINEGSKTLGRQCILVSIDTVKEDGCHKVFDYMNKSSTGIIATEFAQKVVDKGAGELIIRSISKDGMKDGFDIELLSEIAEKVSVPVIGVGGYGVPNHILECFDNAKVSACAIGNELNYTEHSVAIIKSYLSSKTKFIRHETDFKYLIENINSDGRLLKHGDTYLENLIFKKHTKVKI